LQKKPAWRLSATAAWGLLLISSQPLIARHEASTTSCKECADWNTTQAPFRIYGNTYYVGVHGLSSILITSDRGHILIDGDLPESAAKIAAGIRELGFRIEDVKLILNSHVHFDHAGGIAELQRLSGAEVAASVASAKVLRAGHSGPDDPQYRQLPAIAHVERVRLIKDDETLRVGPLQITAHLTPGHTAGGTSWSWKSCEQSRCLDIAYVDSLTAVSDDTFLFTRTTTYPNVLEDFDRSFATVRALPCDILLTPHPEASDLWGRLERRTHGEADALVDPAACRRLAEAARSQLADRVTKERGQRPATKGT
jgi:metallo-beta-lactamase class B